jgi:hypothetical protein
MRSTVDDAELLQGAGRKGEADQVSAFCREVVAAGMQVRLAALLRTPPPGSLYHQPERHGVAVVAAPTISLPSTALAGLMRFRLAQYLDIGFIDRRLAWRDAMHTEPASVVAPGDIHLIAGVPATGEVLCYAVLEQPPDAAAGCRLRSCDRPLYPVERVHGAGLYQRLLPGAEDADVNGVVDADVRGNEMPRSESRRGGFVGMVPGLVGKVLGQSSTSVTAARVATSSTRDLLVAKVATRACRQRLLMALG